MITTVLENHKEIPSSRLFLKCQWITERAAVETPSRLSITAAGPLQSVLLLNEIKVYCKFRVSDLQVRKTFFFFHSNMNMKNILHYYKLFWKSYIDIQLQAKFLNFFK